MMFNREIMQILIKLMKKEKKIKLNFMIKLHLSQRIIVIK